MKLSMADRIDLTDKVYRRFSAAYEYDWVYYTNFTYSKLPWPGKIDSRRWIEKERQRYSDISDIYGEGFDEAIRNEPIIVVMPSWEHEIDLIDGHHRVAGALARNIDQGPAYVGSLKKELCAKKYETKHD